MSEIGSMHPDARIVITGGTGLVGTALTTLLRQHGFRHVVAPGSAECNLLDWLEARHRRGDGPHPAHRR